MSNYSLGITVEASSSYPIKTMTAADAAKVAPVGDYVLGKRFRDVEEDEIASPPVIVGTTNVVSYQ
jgi:hypothetical protein